MEYATLFTGGDLFGVGAELAGLRPSWGVEMDARIADFAELNTGARVIRDRVENVDFTRLPRAFWGHFSPVCKNASQAKKDGKEEVEDVAAAEACARAIDVLQFPEISVENVWGYRTFESFRIICRALERNGYAFNYWHLNAADYGVPQTRKRLILLASKTHRPRRPAPTHSEHGASSQQCLFGSTPLCQWVGWYEAIEDLIPTLPESKFAEWQLKRLPYLNETALVRGDNSRQEVTAGRQYRPTSEPAATVRARAWTRAFIAHPTADNDWFETRGEHEPIFTVKASAAGIPRAFIVDGKPASYDGELQIIGCGEPVVPITASQTRHPFRAFLVTEQYRESNATASADRTPQTFEPAQPSPSVMAEHKGKFRAWLSQGRVVAMTPRALARFQSVPDSYVLPEQGGLACQIIGNGVASLFARRVVESHLEAMRRAA